MSDPSETKPSTVHKNSPQTPKAKEANQSCCPEESSLCLNGKDKDQEKEQT